MIIHTAPAASRYLLDDLNLFKMGRGKTQHTLLLAVVGFCQEYIKGMGVVERTLRFTCYYVLQERSTVPEVRLVSVSFSMRLRLTMDWVSCPDLSPGGRRVLHSEDDLDMARRVRVESVLVSYISPME